MRLMRSPTRPSSGENKLMIEPLYEQLSDMAKERQNRSSFSSSSSSSCSCAGKTEEVEEGQVGDWNRVEEREEEEKTVEELFSQELNLESGSSELDPDRVQSSRRASSSSAAEEDKAEEKPDPHNKPKITLYAKVWKK